MAQIASKACDICMSGPGQNYCQQCGQWLCNNCQSLHLRSKISKHHTFLSGPNINPDDKLFCNEHDDYFIFFCNECDIPICKLCIVKNHKHHDMSEINESTEEIQTKVGQTIETKIQTVKNILDKIKVVTELHESDFKEAIRTLTEKGKQIKQWIDKKVQSLISSIEEKKTESIQALQSIETEFQSDMEILKKRQNSFTNSHDITDVTKRLKQLKLIETELDDIEERESPVMPKLKYFKVDIAEEDIIKLFEGISVQETDYNKTTQEIQTKYSEVPIVSAKVHVMVYDDSSKKWVSAGSANQKGLSTLEIYRHTVTNTFRVVGRKIDNLEVTLNCSVPSNLKYDQSAPTFHQFRVDRQVYGLDFKNKEDSIKFAKAIQLALDTLQQSE